MGEKIMMILTPPKNLGVNWLMRQFSHILDDRFKEYVWCLVYIRVKF